MHTKLGKDILITLAYISIISIINRTDNRQKTDTNFFIAFSESYGSEKCKKKFQHNQKRKNFRDSCNICLPKLRKYNKFIKSICKDY